MAKYTITYYESDTDVTGAGSQRSGPFDSIIQGLTNPALQLAGFGSGPGYGEESALTPTPSPQNLKVKTIEADTAEEAARILRSQEEGNIAVSQINVGDAEDTTSEAGLGLANPVRFDETPDLSDPGNPNFVEGGGTLAPTSTAGASIIPSAVDMENLSEYLSQLGTTADDLYRQIIANPDAFIDEVIDPDTGEPTGETAFTPIAQLVMDRAAIAAQENAQKEQRDYQEKENRLQRAHAEFVATIQTNASLDANQKQAEIAKAQIELEREISALQIASTEQIAKAQADAEKAQADRLFAQNEQQFQLETDRIQSNLAMQLDEAEKRRTLDEEIARLQAEVGLGANVTQERVALENRLAAERSADQQRIADIQVATTQAAAQEAIAKANRDAQTAIANAQASQTTTLAEKELEVQKILQARDEEIARQNRLSQEAVAITQAGTSPFFGLDTPAQRAQAQLAGTGGAFGALGTLAASGTPFTAEDISQAQRGGLTADQQLALARAPGNPFNLSANQQIALQTALARGGLTAEEQFNLQTALARGGLSAEDQFALQTALARGGLTPEQRLAEQRATIASDIFRASPQTLGALSGVLGGNQNLRTALNPFLGTTFTGNGTTTTPTTNMSVPTLRQYQAQTPFEQGATQANFAASGQNLEESILGGTPFGVNIPTGTLSAQNI
tara:strand:+ start:1106 stop:3139 length:2034 start_codon:yes stop_codon:yes gene_type:complete